MQIAQELIAEIEKYERVVVDGIRQASIVWGLVNEFGFD